MALDMKFFEDMEARIPHGKVRTRFAPSPTGYMHVGNLRTALYTWLIARHAGGTFILRIEDTDQGRLVEGATDVIYRTMKECHLDHDEGPDVGGPTGPYIQSERRDLYLPYAQLLVEKGAAYYCFCEKAESEEDSGEFDRADDPCRNLSEEEVAANLAAGKPYVIRQRIPHEGTTTFHDVSFGDITVENKTLDDQVLLKRDGLPTYNFANVVDDHLMGITHVVRGSEYLSSAPKYNLLYEAFGWEVPTYVHCSPVMRDQHNKMSKRHGDPSYEDLKAQGFLTDAILNYVALLGWAPKGEFAEQEIFSLDELVKVFDIAGISRSPAIFDIEKLTYFNATYLRAMEPAAFAEVAEPYIRQAVKNPAIDAAEIAALLQARCEKLTDIPEKVDFFDALPDYDVEFFTNKKSKTNAEVSKAMLEAAIPMLRQLPDWTQDAIHDGLVELAAKLEVKNATLMWPVRIAAAGKSPREIVDALAGMRVDLVLTAHPTEVIRRTLIQKYDAIDECLSRIETSGEHPEVLQRAQGRLEELIAQSWHTDEIRHERPTPVDEAKWGFAVIENALWQTVPTFHRDLDALLLDATGERLPLDASPIRFASWMGGDRDGNPNVTAAVTQEVLLLGRWMAADLYLRDLDQLRAELSMWQANDALRAEVGDDPEPYRALLKQLTIRLEATRAWARARLDGEPVADAPIIETRAQLHAPLLTCYRSLCDVGLETIANGVLLDTLRRVGVFGVTLAKLDVRQDGARHAQCLDELTRHLGIGGYLAWPEAQRQQFLLDEPRAARGAGYLHHLHGPAALRRAGGGAADEGGRRGPESAHCAAVRDPRRSRPRRGGDRAAAGVAGLSGDRR